MEMTHPDILHAERTGYPPNYYGSAVLCALCGSNGCALNEDGICDDCRKSDCRICGISYHADDLYCFTCLDCLNAAACDESTALAYLRDYSQNNALDIICDNIIHSLFKYEQLSGEDIYLKYHFLSHELREIMRMRLNCEPWLVINYVTINWPRLYAGIIDGLRLSCLEDESDFAQWLVYNRKGD